LLLWGICILFVKSEGIWTILVSLFEESTCQVIVATDSWNSWCVEISCKGGSLWLVETVFSTLLLLCLKFVYHKLWHDISLNLCIESSCRCLGLGLNFNTFRDCLFDQTNTLGLLINEFDRIHLDSWILCRNTALDAHPSWLNFNLSLNISLWNIHWSTHIHRLFFRFRWRNYLFLIFIGINLNTYFISACSWCLINLLFLIGLNLLFFCISLIGWDLILYHLIDHHNGWFLDSLTR